VQHGGRLGLKIGRGLSKSYVTTQNNSDSHFEGESPPTGPQRRPVGGILSKSSFWIVVIDLLLVGVFGIIERPFVSGANFQSLALDASEIVLLAAGEAMLLGAGEFDISLGANLVLSSVVGGTLMVAVAGTSQQVASSQYPHLGIAIAVGVMACIVVGLIVGAVNGLIVTRLRVNSLIATLAMYGIASGIADIITNGGNVPFVPSAIQTQFGLANIAGVFPIPAIMSLPRNCDKRAWREVDSPVGRWAEGK